ncbi:uncharacterized protein [Hetaerina americana]|uniref:uncharacterized protein isoform X2 n=1 Tax=Hetaerina americana TaxID=62018 RepID=UPI003A7F2092
MFEGSPRSLPPKSVPASPSTGVGCRSCCRRLETMSADLRCIHLELRRLHVTLTNQLHTLKEAALRPRRRSSGSPHSPGSGDPPDPGLAPLAIARSLEESVGAELRQLRGAVAHLREDLRDHAFARNTAVFGRSASFACEKQTMVFPKSYAGNGIVVRREVHGNRNSLPKSPATLPKKTLPMVSPSDVQQHYTGNKWRNAQVREDIPRARDEQQREVEEAALVHALHEQMLQRQEEIDAQVAQQLAEKIDREEWVRKRQAEERDKEMAWQMQERERVRLERLKEERERVQIVQGANGPMVIPETPSDLGSPTIQPHVMHHQHMVYQQHSSPVQRAHHYSPKMAVTRTNQMLYSDEDIAAELGAMDLGPGHHRWQGNQAVREEHNPDYYHASLSGGEDDHSDFGLNPGISVEEAKRMQEEQDAELARLLQEQEGKRGGGGSVDPLDRDRLLAVEAQDRELARMLQERERAKARRARERGKQRALLKKQQREQQMLENAAVNGHEEDEEPEYGTVVSNGTDNEAENQKMGSLAGQGSSPSLPPHGANGSVGRAERPTDLDLTGSRSSRSSTGVKAKPRQRYPDPEAIEVLPSVGTADSPSIGSSRCANIAMAIDPTYPRRAHPASPPSPAISSLSRGSSPAVGAVAGIGSCSASSSPGMSLPPPDFEDDDSPAPPYMPIQGQRRTSSLEKKGKKGKQKDGCRQQ